MHNTHTAQRWAVGMGELWVGGHGMTRGHGSGALATACVARLGGLGRVRRVGGADVLVETAAPVTVEIVRLLVDDVELVAGERLTALRAHEARLMPMTPHRQQTRLLHRQSAAGAFRRECRPEAHRAIMLALMLLIHLQ